MQRAALSITDAINQICAPVSGESISVWKLDRRSILRCSGRGLKHNNAV
jgi:hypothetical protein